MRHQCHPLVSKHGQDNGFPLDQVFRTKATEYKLSGHEFAPCHFTWVFWDQKLYQHVSEQKSPRNSAPRASWLVLVAKDTLDNLNVGRVIMWHLPVHNEATENNHSTCLLAGWLKQTASPGSTPMFLTLSSSAAFPLSPLSCQLK